VNVTVDDVRTSRADEPDESAVAVG
jgi:hypothetical protein